MCGPATISYNCKDRTFCSGQTCPGRRRLNLEEAAVSAISRAFTLYHSLKAGRCGLLPRSEPKARARRRMRSQSRPISHEVLSSGSLWNETPDDTQQSRLWARPADSWGFRRDTTFPILTRARASFCYRMSVQMLSMNDSLGARDEQGRDSSGRRPPGPDPSTTTPILRFPTIT